MRASAWGIVAAGAAAPLVRKRVNAPAILLQAVAYAAPLGLCVAMRRSRLRDVGACALQMWAYVAAYKSPHDDSDAQRGRVRIDYPIVADRVLGLGELPTTRLQRGLSRNGPLGPEWRALDRVLVWTHWSWFIVPHGALLYILARHPERFPRAAVMTYAVFNIGAGVYWIAPTAPPWFAAEMAAERGGRALDARRMMVEYGEHFWRDGWGSLYSVFGGNPLAAMPSLHFATSLMAALLLAEVSPAGGRARLQLHRDARFRPGVPGRALCCRPARRGRADGRGPSARAAGGTRDRAHRPHGRGLRGKGARGDLKHGLSEERMARADRRETAGGEVEGEQPLRGRRGDSRRRGFAAVEEDMPRVLLTRRQIVAFALFILSGDRLFVLRAAEARGRWHDGAPHRAR